MIKRAAIGTLRLVGSAFRAVFVGVLAVALIAGGVALADYSATQGTGTTFASVVIATKHYMAMVICDATVGETQCAAVKPASTAPGATDPALVVAISPNSVNPNGQATQANSAPVAQASEAATDGSTTITTGGTAQNLFSASTPKNGFEICNPNLSDDLWISMSTTAAANAVGSIRVAANGGCYDTPDNMTPSHAVSIIGPQTGDKITAVQW